MKIILNPIEQGHIRRNYSPVISVDGLVITVDGHEYDLSVIPEGGQAEAEENSPFSGIVTREEVTIKYFYDAQTAELNQSSDLADYTFEITSGPVPDPIVRRTEEVPDEPIV